MLYWSMDRCSRGNIQELYTKLILRVVHEVGLGTGSHRSGLPHVPQILTLPLVLEESDPLTTRTLLRRQDYRIQVSRCSQADTKPVPKTTITKRC